MRGRPVRSQLYLPVTVFGVVSSDWKYVLAAGLIGYTIPYLLDLKLWKIPVELVTSVLGMVATIAALNAIRVGKRPYWLQHHLRAILEDSHHRRWLPTDITSGSQPWLKELEDRGEAWNLD